MAMATQAKRSIGDGQADRVRVHVVVFSMVDVENHGLEINSGADR